MRQNVPLRRPGSVESETDRASRSIDEWLDAAVAEQARRSREGDNRTGASSDLPPAPDTVRERDAPAARSSTALGSMSAWIERAQEDLAEAGRAPEPPRGGIDALSAVERLDHGPAERSRSEALAAQEEAFRKLENRIREIAGRLEAPSGAVRKPVPRHIEDAVVEIRARQAALEDEIAPSPIAEAAPARMLAPSSSRRPAAEELSAMPTKVAPASSLEALRQDVDRLHGSLAALATRSDLGTLERSISMLAQEIAELRTGGGNLAPVEAEVEALQVEVKRLAGTGSMPTEGIGKLARDIDIVSHKLDIVAASGIDPAAIDALSREVADVKRMLGGMAVPADISALSDQLGDLKLDLARIGSRQIDSDDFTSLRVAFEEMRDALSSGAPSGRLELSAADIQQATKDELQPIASMLVMLIEKIERLERHASDPEMLEQIERQIAGLSATIGSTASRDPALSDLSQAMTDLMSEVASWRQGTIDIAEQAARSAVERTLQAMREGAPAAGPSASPQAYIDEHRPDLVASPDLPIRASGGHEEPPGHAVGEEAVGVPAGLAPLSDTALRRLNEAVLSSGLSDADRPLPRAPENEVLLEPGAGRPRSGTEAPAPETGAEDPRDIKASFIAAARRAAQAAAADAEKGKGRPLDRLASAEEGSGQARIRGVLDRLRRPLLVSAAALVVAIGGYRLLAELTAEQPSQIAALKPPPAASQAPAPVITAGAPMKVAALPEAPEPTTTQSVAPPREVPAISQQQQGVAAEPSSAAQANAGAAGGQPPAIDGLGQKEVSQLPPVPASTVPPPKPPIAPEGTSGIPSSLRQAAAGGDAAALYELASRTMEGRGVARDPRAAVALFEKAGEKNLAIAQYRAGNAYEKGIGVARDVEAARRWYQRAAENGNTRAMHNLAVLMAEGVGGKPDYAGAMTWFQKAADQGVRDSQFNLAVLLARGLGTQPDLVRSYAWFAIAAAQGDDEAGRKRDEVGARLQPADLARAKSIVERWRVTPPNQATNEAPSPATWSTDAQIKAPGRA
ncbi:SEL1-like repeat protein [Enterovirga aerilata]|uniref:Sel1 repeat family protein n=1 Tax=Enterovirga aerilata TaxID=2730920 RepID=A0A849I3G5_9HYPH|nr:SEL1-like repeat protein [Enterovirga sp. DB1703]NNM70929.1 hypothetical protein [Enterovirga sp. DB1703]